MKLTKKLVAIAATAVMAMTSAVGMSASAGYSSTMLEPNGSYVPLKINDVDYGFQIRSEVRTTTSNYGKTIADSDTYLHEVKVRNVPTRNVKVESQLYGKSKITGEDTLLSVGYMQVDPAYPSRVNAPTYWIDQYDQFTSFYTTGEAYKTLTSDNNWSVFLSTTTSRIS